MRALWRRLGTLCRPHVGWYALLAALALACIGLGAIQTIPPRPGLPADFAARQSVWLMLGLVAMGLCTLPHTKTVGQASYAIMGICVVLLTLVILPFMPQNLVPTVHGTRAWFDLRIMRFQPSEVGKIAFILTLAWYLRHRSSFRSLWGLLVPFGITLVPVVLILREPDLGTVLLFGPTLLFMLIAAGAKLRHIGSILGLGALAVGASIAVALWAPDTMQVLERHHVRRIRSTLKLVQGDTSDVHGTSFQQYKAMSLIGAGGQRGYGADMSRVLLRFHRMPESHNDMIFAVIVNRWGLVGGATALGLYVMLILSLLLIAARAKEPFGRLLVVGFAGLLFTQVFINVGMNLGLLPIIGITLPFVSYGGSSLLATFAMLGLAINVASRRASIVSRPSFEFDRAAAAA